jgi:hypothetical protein
MVCVNFESAVAIVTRRNQDGVSRLANRLRTDLGEVEQDRDQDDREYSPRAKAMLAAMRMAFRVATITRSFDIGHLAFFFGLRRDSQRRFGSRASLVCDGVEIAPLHWPD